MRTFKDGDIKTLEQILSLKQDSLRKVVSRFLKKHYGKVIETDKYVFCEGTIPIALIAHLDTVFSLPPDEIYYDAKQGVMWSPDGLGADDRAGVFAILKIIQSGLRPHIIFATDEEKGGIGAAALAALDCPFKNLKYIIELDRRGANDCVFYDCDNAEFVEYVETFGFVEAFGSFSDISIICPAWGIAGVNVSIGYRDEHSYSEVLFIGQMLATIEKIKKMLQAKDIPEFKYIPSPYGYGGYFWGNTSNAEKCHFCKHYFMEEELFPIITQEGKTVFCCPDCIAKQVSWCTKCYSGYEKHSPEEPATGLCPICNQKGDKKA